MFVSPHLTRYEECRSKLYIVLKRGLRVLKSLKLGARVVRCDINKNNLESSQSDFTEYKNDVLDYKADVADLKQMQSLVRHTVDLHKRKNVTGKSMNARLHLGVYRWNF